MPQLWFFDIPEQRARFALQKRRPVHAQRKSDARRTRLSRTQPSMGRGWIAAIANRERKDSLEAVVR